MDLVEKIAMALRADRYPDDPWETAGERDREDYRGHARAVLSCIEEEGMVVVPREPTPAMIDAREVPGVLEGSDIRLVWLAMLAAAPKP
jgi:hypothetical protein